MRLHTSGLVIPLRKLTGFMYGSAKVSRPTWRTHGPKKKYGAQRLAEEMKTDRKQVIDFFRKKSVIRCQHFDHGHQQSAQYKFISERILGAAYAKAGNRRSEILGGNSGILPAIPVRKCHDRRFPGDYGGGVRQRAEGVFRQWVYRAGHPRLDIGWTYIPIKKQLKVVVEQAQEKLFDFPLEIGLGSGTGAKNPDFTEEAGIHAFLPRKARKNCAGPKCSVAF